jgi:hypothetical protein
VEAVLYREKDYVESGKLSLIKRNIVLQFTFGGEREESFLPSLLYTCIYVFPFSFENNRIILCNSEFHTDYSHELSLF